MRILTNYNQTYELDHVPSVLDENIYFCTLDYSKSNGVDFYFNVLSHLDQFTRSAADLRIGKHRVQVPLDWSVVIADKNSGNLELLELKHINDRDFQVFAFNPISGYMPSFPSIEIENIFPDVVWTVPEMFNGHVLVIPLEINEAPLCALFVKDTNKLPDNLDITKIFS